jgi:hypothetical protein
MPGQEFHELADAAVGDGAEFVGGDDVDDVLGEALLVDGERRALHLLGGRNDERIELHDFARRPRCPRAAGEGDVALHRLSGCHHHGLLVRAQTGEEDLHRHRAGRDPREPVGADGIGERLQGGAFDGQAGVLEVFAAARIEDPAFDGAGGGGLGGDRRAHRSERDGSRQQAGQGKQGTEDRRVVHGRVG